MLYVTHTIAIIQNVQLSCYCMCDNCHTLNTQKVMKEFYFTVVLNLNHRFQRFYWAKISSICVQEMLCLAYSNLSNLFKFKYSRLFNHTEYTTELLLHVWQLLYLEYSKVMKEFYFTVVLNLNKFLTKDFIDFNEQKEVASAFKKCV